MVLGGTWAYMHPYARYVSIGVVWVRVEHDKCTLGACDIMRVVLRGALPLATAQRVHIVKIEINVVGINFTLRPRISTK